MILDLDRSQVPKYFGASVQVGEYPPLGFLGAVVNAVGAAPQIILNGGTEAIRFGTEIYDIGDWFDVGTPDAFTVPDQVEVIRFTGCVGYGSFVGYVATDVVFTRVIRNGDEIIVSGRGLVGVPPVPARNTNPFTTPLIQCFPGDTFGVEMFVNTPGSAGTAVLADIRTFMAIEAIL